MILPALALLSLPTAAAAAPAWTVQIDPLTFAIGFAHVQVERTLGDHASVYVGPSMRLFDGVLTDVNGPWRAYGAEAGVRWYPLGEAPRGPWLLGRGVAGRMSVTDGSAEPKGGGYASALAGYTGILGEWLVLSGGLGGQHFWYDIGGYGPTGWSVAAHSTVGVAF